MGSLWGQEKKGVRLYILNREYLRVVEDIGGVGLDLATNSTLTDSSSILSPNAPSICVNFEIIFNLELHLTGQAT